MQESRLWADPRDQTLLPGWSSIALTHDISGGMGHDKAASISGYQEALMTKKEGGKSQLGGNETIRPLPIQYTSIDGI